MTRDTTRPAMIEHQIGANGRLNVKVANWDVSLVGGTDDVVRVRDADGAGLPPDLEIARGTDGLSISQPSRFLGSRDGERRLAIEVPAKAAVTVQSASGKIAASGLHGMQQFRTASGDLRLDQASGDLTTETVSGDLGIQVDGSIGLAIKTVSGDVRVEGGAIEHLRLTTTSGDVRLMSDLGSGPHSIASVSGDVWLRSNGGLRITAVTVAGDLRSALPHTSQGGPGRRSLVVGDGATELQFRSVSGDLRVLDPGSAGDEDSPTSRMPPAVPDVPVPPDAPIPPIPPLPPAFEASGPAETDQPDANEAARLEILRALESGEIDVAEATARLAALEGTTDV